MSTVLADCGNTTVKLACGGERARVAIASLVDWLEAHPADELILLPTARASADAVRAAWPGTVREVGCEIPVPQVGQYAGLGLDRIVAGLAAPHPGIVIDAGTATTLSAWDARGRFAGGLILPGPHAMLAGLAACAPALPLVQPLGHDAVAAQYQTVGAIAAATGIGHPAMVLACLARLRAETGIQAAVLTGGGADGLAAVVDAPVLPWLVLDGLARLN
jgi:pantothenate kinase type III